MVSHPVRSIGIDWVSSNKSNLYPSIIQNPQCHHNNGSLHKCQTYEIPKNGGNVRVLQEQNLMMFKPGVTKVADVYTKGDLAV